MLHGKPQHVTDCRLTNTATWLLYTYRPSPLEPRGLDPRQPLKKGMANLPYS
uniref:Uncharacterized protein n=1 Tax=uncultured marine microorganism HF4000_ANIW133B20 TaxID=455528 RepID=B3T3L9_9ZZZZ|nr:hypothetical protein ALOHA_HF4000ANIW133B20ctg3g11 [uncultured marine microorganism HF4000_ANIW133B20]